MNLTRNLLPNKTRFHWRLRKRNKQQISYCTKVMLYSVAALSYAGVAMAGPTGGTITAGSGAITQAGPVTDIDQASQRLDIDWRTFSTQVHESVNFYQPSASALAVNRVTGGVPSELRGALTANGRVFILNNAGVTFFGTSQVNVGALLATTATGFVGDADQFSFEGDGYGQVVNQGNITVSDGGFAILAAPYVANSGVITANLGQIQLVSSNAYTLDLRGDGLITFNVEASTLDDIAAEGKTLGVDNTGALVARSGAVTITAATVSSIVNSVINLDGVVDATAIAAGDGGAVLVASAGDLNITGDLRVDGGASGDGGRVVTWADGTNTFAADATISARGGDLAGDGGFIELSGKTVKLRGAYDASAPNGAAGTLLIDPTDIVIGDSSAASPGADVFVADFEAAPDTNVVLTADNSIVLNDLADNLWSMQNASISLTTTGASSGAGSITFIDTADTIKTGTGDITISATGGTANVIDIGNIETVNFNADITITASGTAAGAQNRVTAGDLTTRDDKSDITVTGKDVSVANARTGGTGVSNAGRIRLTATSGDLDVGVVSAVASTTFTSAFASVDLDAGRDLTVGSVNVEAKVAGDEDSDAIAVFRATAGNDGSGDLTIAGPLNIFANVAQSGSTDNSFDVTALADLDAANDVVLGGDISIQALGAASTVESAEADADLLVNAGNAGPGMIDIDGNILVAASAIHTSGTENASATATASFNAPDNVDITGDITVTAFASGVAESSGDDVDASGFANLYAKAGTDGTGSLTITGNTLVTGTANLVGGSANAEGTARVDFFAGNDVTITGDVTLTGIAHDAADPDESGSASASLDITAGDFGGTSGDIVITGDVTLTAEATYQGTNSAEATAAADFRADNNVTIAGDVTLKATTTVTGGLDADATASADLNIVAGLGAGGGNVDLTGTTLVMADANLGTGDLAVTSTGGGFSSRVLGNAFATADMFVDANAGTSAVGDVTIVGDVTVDADADISIGDITIAGLALSSSFFSAFASDVAGDASADAFLRIDADNDVTTTGAIAVTADAHEAAGNIAITNVTVTESNNATASFVGVNGHVLGTADASAGAVINAGGDVGLNGATTVAADATLAVGDITVTGSASASGTWGEHPNAFFTGFDAPVMHDAEATARLTINDIGGNVGLTGPVTVDANADISAGAITVSGSALSEATESAVANAHFVAFDDALGSDASAFAGLTIERAGGDVSLATTTVTADAELSVGAITIDGTADASAGSSSSAFASFTGFNGDVFDGSASANADANIRDNAGALTLAGGFTVAATAGSAVNGAIAITGIADALASFGGDRASASFIGVDGDVFAGDANADASADLSRNGAVAVTGGIAVTADTDIAVGDVAITGSANADASSAIVNARFTGISDDIIESGSAFALLEIDSTRGDVAIDGIEATADTTITVGTISIRGGRTIATASGSVFERGGAIARASGTSASARASFEGIDDDVLDSGFADARVDINDTRGNVSIGGDVTVDANLDITVGAISIDGIADALASDGAGRADVFFEGIDNSVIDGEASATASFAILRTGASEGASGGDVVIGGAVTVAATSLAGVGDLTVTGEALASALGGATASADFYGFNSDVFDSDASARAFVDLNSNAGDVTLNGPLTVTADGRETAGAVSITGMALASAASGGSSFGEGGSGGYGGRADAGFTGFDGNAASGARGSADVNINRNGGNVTLSGITIHGDADIAIGAVTIGGQARATTVGDGRASASYTGFSSDVISGSADGSGRLDVFFNSGHTGDFTVNGEVDVRGHGRGFVPSLTIDGSALARVSPGSGAGYGGDADAWFEALNDELFERDADGFANVSIDNVGGDVTFNGGIALDGDGTLEVGPISITGKASAVNHGANTGSRASAFFSGVEDALFDGTGSGDARLSIRRTGGDVTVTGAIDANATGKMVAGDMTFDLDAIAIADNGARARASATAFDSGFTSTEGAASASININSNQGDVTLGGGVSARSLTVMTIGDITIDGLASAIASHDGIASARATGFGAELFSDFEATDNSARVSLRNNTGDITISGGVAVDATFVTGLGDITILGVAKADADDPARATATVTGFDDVIYSGDDSENSVNAAFTIDGPVGGGGDVTIDGGISVAGTFDTRFGDIAVSGTASAQASSSGIANASVTGFSSELFSTATDYSADAFVTLRDIDSLTVTGDIAVLGVSKTTFGDLSVTGLATASGFDAGSARASFTGFDDDFASDLSDVSANADLRFSNIAGDVTVNGDIAVNADMSFTVGDITVDGRAFALGEGSAGGATSIGHGRANFTGFYGEIVNPSDASAYASIDASGIGGDFTVNGRIDVTATGELSAGDITVSGTANADASSEGFASANVTALGSSVIGSDLDVSASVDLRGIAGAITLNGGVAVDAMAAVAVGDVSVTGKAVAEGTGSTARASFMAIDGLAASSAYAEANFNADAGTDFTNTGGIAVNADGEVSVGNIDITGTASELGVFLGSSSATFDFYLYNAADDASASGRLDIFANGGIDIDGGVSNTADARVSVGDITIALTDSDPSGSISIGGNIAGSAFASAFTTIEADGSASIDEETGEAGPTPINDITIIGGAATRADATIDVGAISETVNGSEVAYISGEGGVLTGGAFAEGSMEILAAQDVGTVGDIFIEGDVTVDATATVSGDSGSGRAAYGPALAVAFGHIDARNDVTLLPTAEDFFVGNDVRAKAIADTDGSDAVALAAMVIEAGERDLVPILGDTSGSEGYGGDMTGYTEEIVADGNLAIKGDVLSLASANADSEVSSGSGQGFFGEGFGGSGEIAAALLDLTAHGEPDESGNFTNEFYHHEPQAIARLGDGTEEFTDATQSDLDATVDNDLDGSPYTFAEGSPAGFITPVTEGEIDLPSDDFFDFFFGFGFGFEGFDGSSGAATFVHFHGEATVFEMPMGGDGGNGFDPYILIKEKPVPEGEAPVPGAASLGLLPGSVICSLGEDALSINSDGQVLFTQFFFEQTALGFGEDGCNEVVSYPQAANQSP